MRRFRATERRDVPRPVGAAGRGVLLFGSAVVAGLLATLARERVRARRLEAAVHDRLRLGRDGIVVGAAPETLLASRTHAVLVVHGFGDTPQSVRALGYHLHAAGYTVELPLLPGHGRTLAEFGLARAHDWIGYVRDQVARLRRQYPHVSLVGLSMGAALCVIAAAERADLDALVLLSPYLSMPDRIRRLAPLLRMSGPLSPFRRSTVRLPSILDPVARAAGLGYGVVSGRLLAELHAVTEVAEEALPALCLPTRVLAARHDNRVPVAAAVRHWRQLGAPIRDFQWMERSGHIMTVDYEHKAVQAHVLDWLNRFSPV
jgi:carboxylesterase